VATIAGAIAPTRACGARTLTDHSASAASSGRSAVGPLEVDPGAVDQDADAAAERGGGLHGEGADGGGRGADVGGDEVGSAAGVPDRAHGLLAARRVAAADGDVGALGGQRLGDRAADAAGGAGDQGGPA
jgi:hypothetical protein